MKIDTEPYNTTAKAASQSNTYKSILHRGERKRMNDVKKEILFSEFHSLLSSGVDFNRAFELLIRGEKEGPVKTLLESLHKQVIRGDSLWKAFAGSGSFTALDSGVVRIGEETGKLNESLIFLSDYYHKKIAQRRMVTSAVSYPAIILATAIIVLVFMILVIVPMFEQVYARMGGELPGITKMVIAFSRHFKGYAIALSIVAAGCAVLFSLNRHTAAFRKAQSAFLLKTPLLRDFLRKHYQSHFCKLVYLLYSSGVPLLRGMEMMKDVITFYPYQRSFEAIAQGLRRGESFAGNMAAFPELYDQKLLVLLRVGEETNRLSDMLRKQGEDLSVELEYKLKQLGNMLEPLLIFFVGVLVAVVLISMYLPMFKLGGTIY